MPKAQRGAPPYVQIQDHYRERIRSGEIGEGERLPSIAALAEEWGVAAATAAKAIGGLQVEGYVYSSTQGTFATVGKGAAGGADLAMRRGRVARDGQRIEITQADVRPAPVYVAELLGLEPAGATVARREWITFDGPQPGRISVSWWPGELAAAVPRLATAEDGDPLAWIFSATGRRPTIGRDYFEGREADVREARALGIRPGDAVLASTYLWSDDDGVIEYGEFVLPRKRVVSLAYTIDAAAA
jgi:GntR family transcriptional regulator